MNYVKGIEEMQKLTEQLEDKATNYTASFVPHKEIIIEYPGKGKTGDYRLKLSNNGIVPTHPYICRLLFGLICERHYTYETLLDLLNDVYFNGTDTVYHDQNLEYLKNLIFWTTLQEEINYPRTLGYSGINLPYCRYFEAIYCTKEGCLYSINEVTFRCNNHGRKRPSLYDIPNAPAFYK